MNLDKIPQNLKAEALKIGSLFGSPNVLDETQRSLQAQDKHSALLAQSGYNADDRAYVEQVRDALVAALDKREGVFEDRSEAFSSLRALRAAGKEARRDARDVLALVSDDLLMSGEDEAHAQAQAALHETRRSGADLALLATQLEALSDTMGDAKITAALEARGEQGFATRLTSLATQLRQGVEDAPRLKGAHAESEQINILDGLLILKLRRIRDIARRTARKRGEPALANDFSFAYL